jgi:hypothetical protein
MKTDAQDVRRHPPARGSGEAAPGARRDASFESSVRIKTSDDADSTDPEVPTAKRLRRASHRRAEILTTAVAVSLFLLGVVLVYETGRQVSRERPESSSAGAAQPRVSR